MYAEDPLVFREKFKAKWVTAFLDCVKQVRPRIQEITLPLFIMHGTEDRLVLPSASRFVYDNINCQDKTSEVMLQNSPCTIITYFGTTRQLSETL